MRDKDKHLGGLVTFEAFITILTIEIWRSTGKALFMDVVIILKTVEGFIRGKSISFQIEQQFLPTFPFLHSVQPTQQVYRPFK